MRKIDEAHDPNSCFNRAKSDEMVFVLLGHDVAAPRAIRAWTEERILRGKNVWTDAQIQNALRDAETMEREAFLRAEEEK